MQAGEEGGLGLKPGEKSSSSYWGVAVVVVVVDDDAVVFAIAHLKHTGGIKP